MNYPETKSKTMLQIKTNYNYRDVLPTGEINNEPSLTVPDQSLTVSEILSRFTRGLPVSGARIPIYDVDDDMPDPRTMDLADRQSYAEYAQEQISALKARQEEYARFISDKKRADALENQQKTS